ncbi:Ifh1p KNAG_0A02520 [Huiozyma naganishii CBS 8797]|uniref:Protein IFH1 n=1 Tax=Huiozyma naganishii (strain ATCC MYA-139 / BCRC 22969 / CBS 8797 / KCTC 17520 / NBRC 10181 / NCYC 3082 / Yp74L-3) TaxID=1071383 RepID=J7S3E0_HUIN7|nr:hypothetical protein KNAG_0A02520 [Kazachstania naganishii CBS 8797]CCK67941.1 hypothetical protein KNAG_0A02520 [Kazachstania naganishii CBS 8797]
MAGKKVPVGGAYMPGRSSGKSISSFANRAAATAASAENKRPRRFSLIYSSDSSLSDIDADEKKGKSMSNNSKGKKSKLIAEGNEDGTESSDYGIADSSNSEDDDDDEDDDSEETSSDDDNIDFVKLTAQRKKRVMKALNAIKRGKKPATKHSPADRTTTQSADTVTPPVQGQSSTGPRLPSVQPPQQEEDIGEEVTNAAGKDTPTNELTSLNSNVDQLHVPKFPDSEESDYDIDQETYFNIINDNDDTAGEIDTGGETNEDELPILQQEEQNIVQELQNDDSLSFDGSIHEEGADPVDLENQLLNITGNNNDDDYDEDDEDDDMMSDFDLPFYEDPKFSNLHYNYTDENNNNGEHKLSLSTSLPLILNEKKQSRTQKLEAKRRELKERLKSRKLLKEKVKSSTNKTDGIDGDEYMFGVFFQSDMESPSDSKYEDGSDKRPTLRKQNNTTGSLRNLNGSALIDTSDEEYDNILMDIAHMPSDESDEEHSTGKKIKLEDELGASDIDIDDDDSSVTNVFIDIDDLDPDSFYFQYDDISSSSAYENGSSADEYKDEMRDTVVFAADESTDEDDNLPPPDSRNNNIGTKAKEIVSANVVGLKPPKLGTWETDNKPFSIIDGLSTKSLHSLIQEHQQLHDQTQRGQTTPNSQDSNSIGNGEEMSLNELLNMSELDDDEGENSTPYQSALIADWYNKPKVPLSAFRNKGVSYADDSEYILPSISTRKVPIGYVGVEKTRRKISKMKEMQRQRNEQKRKLKKKRKLLKLKRERARMEKEKALLGEVSQNDAHLLNSNSELAAISVPGSSNENTEGSVPSNGVDDAAATATTAKRDSVQGVGIAEITELLNKDHSGLLTSHADTLSFGDGLMVPADEDAIIDDADADILASLTAPVDFDDLNSKSSTLWKQRRHSIVEAASENMRFTKNGLFSESALADIEGIIGASGSTSGTFEFNEVLQ